MMKDIVDAAVNREFGSFPPQAVAIAKSAVIDTVAVTIAGVGEESSRLAVRAAALPEGLPGVNALGVTRAFAPADAAMIMGHCGHALDYDDTNPIMMGHPSVTLTSALLAIGQIVPLSGKEFLAAFMAGFEVNTVLGRMLNPPHYAKGWHGTSTIGVMGACLAGCMAARLGAERSMNALALAATQAGGFRQNFGTMAKPMHAGFAARNAVTAVLLAREGFTGSPEALTGKLGYLNVFSAATLDATALEERFRQARQGAGIEEVGAAMKFYASAAPSHCIIEIIKDLQARHGMQAAGIARVRLGINAIVQDILIFDRPRNGTEAKFSARYCAAALLADGGLTLDTFRDPAVRRITKTPLYDRIEVRVEDDLQATARERFRARVTVEMEDGTVLTSSDLDHVRASQGIYDQARLHGKFRECVDAGLGPEAGQRLLASLRDLEALADVREVLRLAESMKPRIAV